jgi:polar amino acid transport system substrate-binding protein
VQTLRVFFRLKKTNYFIFYKSLQKRENKKMKFHISKIFCLILNFYFICTFSTYGFHRKNSHKDENTMNVGWDSYYPLTYTKRVLGTTALTGLDIELTKAVAERADYSPVFIKNSWALQLKCLRKGSLDMLLPSLKSRERMREYRISIPVRKEKTVIYVKDGSSITKRKFRNITALLQWLKKNCFKAGVTKGNIYTNDEVNAFVANPLNAQYIKTASSEYINLRNLVEGKVAAVFIDRIAGASIVGIRNWQSELKTLEHPAFETKEACYLLSRKTSTDKDLKKINKAITQLKSSGEYDRILKTYLTPVILQLTVNSQWYFYIILTGMIAYCICGIRLIIHTRQSLIGALFFTFIYTLGGGILRGVITGKYPLFIFKEPVYIYTILIITLPTFVIINLFRHISCHSKDTFCKRLFSSLTTKISFFYVKYIHDIIDSIGLAGFIVFGVIAALEVNAEPLILWGPILAMITTSGGSIMCNALQTIKFDKTMKNMYTEIAAIWGGVLSIMLHDLISVVNINQRITLAVSITVVGAFITRLLVCYFKIPSIHFILIEKSVSALKKTK